MDGILDAEQLDSIRSVITGSLDPRDGVSVIEAAEESIQRICSSHALLAEKNAAYLQYIERLRAATADVVALSVGKQEFPDAVVFAASVVQEWRE